MAFVQSKSVSYFASADPRTLALDSGVGEGNLLVVCVSTFRNGAGTPTIVTVSDDVNGPHAQAGSYSTTDPGRCSIWFKADCGAGATTVTVTPDAGAYVTIAIHEYSDVVADVSVRSHVEAIGSSSSPSPGAVTTGQGDLVVAAYGQGNNTVNTTSIAAPFTERENSLNGIIVEGIGTADHFGASAGTETATWTLDRIVAWAAIAVSFIIAESHARCGSFSSWGCFRTVAAADD